MRNALPRKHPRLVLRTPAQGQSLWPEATLRPDGPYPPDCATENSAQHSHPVPFDIGEYFR